MLYVQKIVQSQSCRPSTRTSPLSSSSAPPSCWTTERLCCNAETKYSSFSLQAGLSLGWVLFKKKKNLFANIPMTPLAWFLAQPSGNTGSEQHTKESWAPFVQLLQALRLGLYKHPLQSTQDQRRGLFLPAPEFSCFKVISTVFNMWHQRMLPHLWKYAFILVSMLG